MPNVSDEQLLEAAEIGDLSVLKKWKEQNKTQDEGVDINKVKDYIGWTPLHEACRKGQLECIESLIRGLSPSAHPQLQQLQQRLQQNEQANEQPQEQLGQQLKRKKQENEHKHSSHKRTNISIGEDRLKSFQTENRTDTIFLCGQGDQQQLTKANAQALIITLPSIETLIDKGTQLHRANDDAHDGTEPIQTTIPLPNLQPKHVRYVLQCIYTGEISFNDSARDNAATHIGAHANAHHDTDASHQPTPILTGQDDLQQLILVANEFGFWRLKLVLEAELARKHLTEDTMIDVLIFADQHNCLVLKDAAMRMAAESEKDMFTHLDLSKLILQPQLMTEIQVFCSGRAESDGNDDECTRMSMVELHKVI
uniref:BTB domain-containing protein n=1 Tax=Craspedostauros australis TaxID=1486917 RepID=A0A7R9ZND9_9STRA